MKINFKAIGLVAVVFIVLGGGVFWVYRQVTKELPGSAISDLGREHLTDISSIEYNSNPPTSGSHFPIWATRGVYDKVLSDGYLIHSLEHGYIVISYNCEVTPQSRSIVREVLAHETEEIHEEATPSAEASSSAFIPLTKMNMSIAGSMNGFNPQNAPEEEIELPQSFSTDSCSALVSELGGFLNEFQRVVIVPRMNMDNYISLTAWNRIEKLDKLDKERIRNFIKAFHNLGPEKTDE